MELSNQPLSDFRRMMTAIFSRFQRFDALFVLLLAGTCLLLSLPDLGAGMSACAVISSASPPGTEIQPVRGNVAE